MANLIKSNTTVNGYISLNAGGLTQIGESFAGDGEKLDSCSFNLKRTGSPTGNMTAYLYAHTGTFGSSSVPTGAPLATSTNTPAASSVGTIDGLFTTFNFDGTFTLVNGTNYVIVVEYTGGDASNKINVGVGTGNPITGNESQYSGSWAATSNYDIGFNVYGNTVVSPRPQRLSLLGVG